MLINIIKKSTTPTIDDSPNYLDCLWLDTTNYILKRYNSELDYWEDVSTKSILELRDNQKFKTWVGTKSEFEYIDILDANTIYFVKNSGIFIGNNPVFRTNKIIYVNCNYTGNHKLGCSWDFPFTELQAAIDSASENDVLWIAQGTYKSDGYRGQSFFIDKPMTLIGGFEGTEISIYDRKSTSGTVFTGEGIRTIINVSSNNVTFDGIEFINGYTLVNNGGAIYSDGNTIVKRCKFVNNTAVLGGAIYNAYKILDCLFINNSCINTGNAIYTTKSTIISGCTFVNGARNSCIYSTSSIEFYNSIIWNKNVGGDGVVYDEDGTIISNCAATIPLNGANCLIISRTNAGTDPGIYYAKFKNPLNNNFELSNDSDLIGIGNYAFVELETDLNLKPRVFGLKVDLGCYENQEINSVINANEIYGLTKESVGLGNVDNTSDLDKPVSNATEIELNELRCQLNKKADLERGVIKVEQIPAAVLGDLSFQGVWDAYDNLPHLIQGDTGSCRNYYICSTEGIQFGYHFVSGDYVVNDHGTWKKISHVSEGVSSVNGYTGVVVIHIDDIPELHETLRNKADLVDGRVPMSQLPVNIGANVYLGEWDAESNLPQLINDPELSSSYYKVAVAGSYQGVEFRVNDLVINLDGNWYRILGNESFDTGTEIIVDSELSTTSENPVQNRVVTARFNTIPEIELDEVNNILIINGHRYILTPEDVKYRYYVGWSNWTVNQFSNKTVTEILNSVSHYSVLSDPTYSSTAEGTMLILILKSNVLLDGGALESNGFRSNLTLENFNLTGPQDVVIEGGIYSIYAFSVATMNINSDLVNLTFKINNNNGN